MEKRPGTFSRKRSASHFEHDEGIPEEEKPEQDEVGGSSRSRPASQNQREPNQAGDCATGESGSAKTRKEGNEKYEKAMQDGIPPLIKCSGLEDAAKAYIKAASAASTAFGPTHSMDWSSATKNYGMVKKRLAQVFMQQEKNESESSFVRSLSAFKESLKSMNEALQYGVSCQPLSWGLKVQEEIKGTYLEIFEIINLFDLNQKFKELYQVVKLLPSGTTQARAKFHIADAHFKESVRLLEHQDYKSCLCHLHDINQPVEEALSVLAKKNPGLTVEAEDLMDDLEVLKKHTLYHFSTVESLQARKCGEKMLAEMLENEVGVNMDVVLDVVDWFKQASLKAAELDLEQEAAALSFLGLVNEKILFSTEKTKGYYKRCLELVEAARPKTFLTETWYQQCVAGYRKIQDIEHQRDDREKNCHRQKVLETLTAEIKALKEANTSAGELLAHIYKHHAPAKGRKCTEEHLKEFCENEQGMDSQEKQKARKKIFLKVYIDFHPDKFIKEDDETEEDQEKRKIFNEEITKMLTHRYEVLKLA